MEAIVIPVAAPLPGVSNHVVEPKTVRLIGGDGRCSVITVFGGVLVGNVPCQILH